MFRPVLAALLTAVALFALGGCTAEERVDEARMDLERRVERARADVETEFRRQRDKIRGRVREFIAQIEQVIPEAPETDPTVRARGRAQPQTIEEFMEDVLASVDS